MTRSDQPDSNLTLDKYLDGLLLVCGQTRDADVELRVLKYRDKRHLKDPPLSWAIYQGPPPERRPISFTLDDLRRIDGREHLNERELLEFLSLIRAQRLAES